LKKATFTLPRTFPLNRILLWFCGIAATTCTAAQAENLSEQAVVSILTCGPGTDEYSIFGHSALRIKDPQTGFDVVYNYGTFNPRLPGFIYHFVKGDLQYWVSSVPFNAFLQAYMLENRSVSEQILALDPNEVRNIYTDLQQTMNSPDKYYRYQFFDDNCSTRLFDIVSGNVAGSLKLDSTGVNNSDTYRHLLAPYTSRFPWIHLGVNLALGFPADTRVSFQQRMFLPAGLEKALSKIMRGTRPLVAETNVLFNPAVVSSSKSATFFSPFFVLLALTLFVLATSFLPGFKQIVPRFFLVLVGLVGCVLTVLSLFSLHKPLQFNYQVLWFLPTHLLFIKSFSRKTERSYLTLSVILLLSGAAIAYSRSYLDLLPELRILLGLILMLLFQRFLFSKPALSRLSKTNLPPF
jgi:hypothetical protein